ncbi:hydantoinase B/oxoprolinase family protein [Sorangium sp. So ce1036]|uniref:hydantoinase B/oxoprolinase family protein n=1 Tax=Sorangium sp. So ce1036 TaxID=3133328 RepID=UPI003F122AFD
MSREARIDPFTLEIIKNELIAAGDEMFHALKRAAMSPIIYEVLDYATGLTDARGNLLSQGNGVADFISALGFGVAHVLDKMGRERLASGDIVILNDPYVGGGTHLSDVALILPIFHEGELVAFAVDKAHWTEVGGKDPGSWTTDATDVFQEGLQFPGIKLFRAGRPDEGLLELIRANVRTPDATLGDLHACVGALRVGERALHRVLRKFGKTTVRCAMEELLDEGERRARLELARLPRGTYEATDFVDDDGVGNGPFEVRVKITLDDRFVCDFTGTAAQVPGPINCGRTSLCSAVRQAWKAITDPLLPSNEGVFRPVHVICPPGTIFTAERPAPVSTYWETAQYATDLVCKAMAPLVPRRLTAGHFLSVCGTLIHGIHPDDGTPYLLVEPQAGGWGAGADKDGENGLVCAGDGETYMIPVEICETRYGVRVEQYALDIVDGGAGEHRGGRGLVRDYRVTSAWARVTATFGRHRFAPWGLNGGQQGSPNIVELVHEDGRRFALGKCARHLLQRGELCRLRTGTGGGHGDPARRSRARVLDDLRCGYITLEQARRDYGLRDTEEPGPAAAPSDEA